MALSSQIFRNDVRLQACAANDASHVVPGAIGSHVGRIHTALFVVDGLRVATNEERSHSYGPSTAAAILDFKTRRGIINSAYQTKPDAIVGKMTIAALDAELIQKQRRRLKLDRPFCGKDPRLPRGASGPSVTLAVFRPGAGGATASLVGTSSASSPASVAKQRVAVAALFVSRALARLSTLINDRARPSVPTSPGVLDVADALWANFGEPVFPLNNPLLDDGANGAVKNLGDYLNVVQAVLQGIAVNLGQAATLFRDLPGPAPAYANAGAFTLSLGRVSGDPPFPDGIYFTPLYLQNGQTRIGPLKQAEIAIHECGHMVQNNNIADLPNPKLGSAHGYSNFVLHCAIGREVIQDAE